MVLIGWARGEEHHCGRSINLSLRLERQSFRVKTVVGENTAQSVVEGDVSLPSNRPDIGRALRVRAHPAITEYEVAEGRVTFEGNLDVDLLYASFSEAEAEGDRESEVVLEERLEKGEWPHAMPFTFVLDVAGAEPGMLAKVGATVESVTFEVLNDQRSLNVDVVLNFAATVSRVDEYVFTTRVFATEEVEASQEEVRLQLPEVTAMGQARVEGFLPFGGRVLPSQVLELAIRPSRAPSAKLSAGSAEVSGELSCSVLYSAQEVGAAFAEWDSALPFEVTVQLPEFEGHAGVQTVVSVTDVDYRVVDTEENRGLAVEATVLLLVGAEPRLTLNVVTDIVAEGLVTVATRKESVFLQEAVGEGRLTTSVDSTLELPAGAASIDRILQTEAKARVEDVHVLGDKVVIEGVASLALVYVGRSGDTTTLTESSWPAGIVFELEVPVPGAEPGLERRADVLLEDIRVDLINRETVEVVLTVTANVALSRAVELEALVEATEVGPADPNPPTYTFVVLQEGDTLWQLAKKYHTEVTAILQANKWLEDENTPLSRGAKLCIPRGRLSVA